MMMVIAGVILCISSAFHFKYANGFGLGSSKGLESKRQFVITVFLGVVLVLFGIGAILRGGSGVSVKSELLLIFMNLWANIHARSLKVVAASKVGPAPSNLFNMISAAKSVSLFPAWDGVLAIYINISQVAALAAIFHVLYEVLL